MAITVTSEADLFAALMALYQAQFTDRDMGEHSYLGKQSRAEAQALSLLMRAVQLADFDSVPAYKQDSDGTTISRCSSAAIDMWALTYGLPTDTSGVFGRRGARGSSGGVGTPACTIGGTLIAAGSTATDPTGQITVQTVANVTTNGPPNTLPVTFESVTTGLTANLPKNTILTWTAPPAGVAATVTLTTGLSSGRDRESDGELLARLLFRIQNPPRGGTAADYRYWAENSTDASQNNKSNNIFRAHVYPERSGGGSVDVMPLLNSSGTGRDPLAGPAAAVLTYLNSVRPVTATVNVIRPHMPSTLALRIRVKPTAKTKYAYDWADSGTSTTITAFNEGAKTITTAAIPANLQAAIDASKKPRVQIVSSTSSHSPKPYQARCTAGAAGVLTLETWPFPAGTGPVAGTDYFYAGGPIVDLTATALLTYIDSLGPSNQTGFADEFDSWDWKVSLSRICDEVMDVRDTDGTKMIDVIPNLTGTAITIAVGAGAFSAADYSPKDVVGNCELPFLRAGGIEIIQAA